jgi:hypothetical protein
MVRTATGPTSSRKEMASAARVDCSSPCANWRGKRAKTLSQLSASLRNPRLIYLKRKRLDQPSPKEVRLLSAVLIRRPGICVLAVVSAASWRPGVSPS